MKKTLLLIAIAVFISSTAFSQFKFGVGATLGTKTGMGTNTEKISPGLNVRGMYELSETWSLTAGASYFLPTTGSIGGNTAKYSYMYIINVGAVYYFSENDDMKMYGLVGINHTAYKAKRTGYYDLTEDGRSFEVGGGVEFDRYFAEVKYDGNLKQIVATVGIYF